MHAVIGIGTSDDVVFIGDALGLLRKHPSWLLLSTSRLYQNAAVGGVTHNRFVNAAVVVHTALGAQALLSALHAIEGACGRVRAPSMRPSAARTLDLDLLWIVEMVTTSKSPAVPHPRLSERAFAVIPALEALRRARLPAPRSLLDAARAHGHAPLLPLGEAPIASS